MDPVKLTHVLGRTWAIEGSGLMGLYRLDGGKCILLDSGELFERQALADTLADAGLTPVGVLSSHIHTDHSINNGWLRRTYGCLAAAPAGEVHLSLSPLSLKGYLYCYSPGTLDTVWGEMASPVDCPIPGGDGVFSFCGVDFTIVHTPGHSLDHLCVITPDNVCYTGDAVFSNEMLTAKLPYGFYLAGMMDSARKLRELDCAAYIVSHRGIHPEIAPLVDSTIELLLHRAEEIRALVTRPMTWGEVWQAVNEHFSLLSSHPVRAALMERNLRSFLDYLADVGELKLSAGRGLTILSP